MTRTILTALLMTIAASAIAQDPTPTRFFIERIEVRNARRVSTDVVVAESRLREGHEYSEAEIHDASNRLARLPFLLSADFSLERGSERGRHLLVISIVETKPFFYALDMRPILTDGRNVAVDYSDHLGSSDKEMLLGARFFVGRRGAFHLGLVGSDLEGGFADEYSSFDVGYTQYDLFGTRAFATVNLKQIFGTYGGALSPELVLGIPLAPNQTLTTRYTESRLGSREETIRVPFEPGQPPENVSGTRQEGQRLASVKWSHNTTNHPFHPTRGSQLSVTPTAAWHDAGTFLIEYRPGQPWQVRPYASHSLALSLEVDSARYWEVSDRDSVMAGLSASYGEVTSRSSIHEDVVTRGHRVTIQGGYSHSLWPRDTTRFGDSRLEATLRLGVNGMKRRGDYFFGDDYSEDLKQVSTSWLRRSSWGTLRLGVGYAW